MPLIIIDRKRKRRNFDNQWKDPLGTEEARKEKMRSIEIDSNTSNVIELYLLQNPLKSILHKKIWAFKKKKEGEVIVQGHIVDLYPEKILLIRMSNNVRIPVDFDHVISMEGS